MVRNVPDFTGLILACISFLCITRYQTSHHLTVRSVPFLILHQPTLQRPNQAPFNLLPVSGKHNLFVAERKREHMLFFHFFCTIRHDLQKHLILMRQCLFLTRSIIELHCIHLLQHGCDVIILSRLLRGETMICSDTCRYVFYRDRNPCVIAVDVGNCSIGSTRSHRAHYTPSQPSSFCKWPFTRTIDDF